MRIKIFFWKETNNHPGSEEPEQIEIPRAKGEEHPRNQYLDLMQILLEREGTMSFVEHSEVSKFFAGLASNKEARTQKRVRASSKKSKDAGFSNKAIETAVSEQVASLALSAFGGAKLCKEAVGNIKITGHTLRKTGTSAALNTGAIETLVQRLGFWSEKSGVPKAYRCASYAVSDFCLGLFDWLRGS